jgi:MoxR-like ATPase
MTTSKAWDEKFTSFVTDGIIGRAGSPLHRVCISGYSRTGKSTLVQRLLKGERITFHQAMPLDDLIGGWALIDGRTVWVDGPAVRALKEGKCLLIDEANFVPPECQTMFYALLDDPAGITLPNGQRVEAAPGYCVVATMNPDPTCLPHPVYDRFDIYLKATTLSKGTREALGQFANNAEAVIGFGQPKLTWKRPASVNAFLAANKLRKIGVSDEAIAETLGWEDREASDFLIAASAR